MRPAFKLGVVTPTRRERELIELVGRGLRNRVIASQLNISENTVRAHIRNIMRKYKLRNRTQIAIMFPTQSDLSPIRLAAKLRDEMNDQ
jgi:DNA-binding NarL/FixJ family response regulator